MSLVVEDLIHALPVQQDVLFVQKTEQIPIAVNARLMVVLNTIFYQQPVQQIVEQGNMVNLILMESLFAMIVKIPVEIVSLLVHV